jgi:hypothetical protein
MALGIHVGSATLHEFDARQTAALKCDKKKPALHAKYTTSPVEPDVALLLPLPGGTSAGTQASARHVGSVLLQTFVGRQTDGFAWLNA